MKSRFERVLNRAIQPAPISPQLISFLELTAFLEGFEHGDERLKETFRRLVKRCLSAVLNQIKDGADVAELARELGVTEAILHGWQSKYGDLDEAEAHDRRECQEQRHKRASLIANLSRDRDALKYLPTLQQELGRQ